VIGNSIFCIGVIQDDKIKEKAQKLYSFLLSKMKKLLRCGRIQILVAIWFLLRKNSIKITVYAFLKIFHDTKQFWFFEI